LGSWQSLRWPISFPPCVEFVNTKLRNAKKSSCFMKRIMSGYFRKQILQVRLG
jgi:hypothetical protein